MRHAIFILTALCCLTALAALSAEAHAQTQRMFAGYDALCGLPVIVFPNPQNASASYENGRPVIYVDPGVMANWTMSRRFTLAHECGHHRLGHVTPRGLWFRTRTTWATRAQELDADCWAARALARQGQRADLQRMIQQFASSGHAPTGHNYPTGMERAQRIAQCANLTAPATTTHHHTLNPHTLRDPNPPKRCRIQDIPCQHPAHPAGDRTACRHRAHPGGDVIPCRHMCRTQWGPRPCHPRGDLIECQHRAHPGGDLVPCTHRLHTHDTRQVCY